MYLYMNNLGGAGIDRSVVIRILIRYATTEAEAERGIPNICLSLIWEASVSPFMCLKRNSFWKCDEVGDFRLASTGLMHKPT